MNIQALYEYVILRDILAYILPGSISIAGVAFIAQAYGIERWNKLIFSLVDLSSWAFIIALIMIAFLVGHIIDMFYRLVLQGRDWYRRPQTIRKMLTGSEDPAAAIRNDPIRSGIRKAVAEFIGFDWESTSIDEWISSGKAFESTTLLGYWIEQVDSRLFNAEIGRPVVQAHFLHASGIAFLFFGFCVATGEVLRWLGLPFMPSGEPLANLANIIAVWILGIFLILQGRHKRDILIEHTYRVFFMLWRHRKCFGQDQMKAGDDQPQVTPLVRDPGDLV